jgi:DNA-binding beta-propeller fold protein YncE
VTELGGECGDGFALDLARGVAVSPDGRNVYVAAQLADAIVILDRNLTTGALTQKSGTAGCISETGGQCTDGVALNGANSVVVSPDGRNVYATAGTSDSVLVYDRDLATGALSLKPDVSGCVSEDGTGMACDDGVALNQPHSVAVSPDGRNVYIVSADSDAVAVFDRDSDGVLSQKGAMAACVSEGGAGGCTPGVAMNGASALAVSPDGKNVYVGARLADSVVILDRDVDTGVLAQKNGTNGCVSEDGTMLDCVNGAALDFAIDAAGSVAVSPDGSSVYVATKASDAVAVFDRDLLDGTLTQKAGLAACVSLDGTSNMCTQGVALGDPVSVRVSPDGKSVYVSSSLTAAVAAFDRSLSTGVLTQKTGVAACVSHTGTSGTCVDGLALIGPDGLAVSPDGRHLYVATSVSDGVAVFTRDVPSYDIDGDGQHDALTDALLLLRYLFGFTGSTLITGAVDLTNCTRCTAPEIEAYIAALLGP